MLELKEGDEIEITVAGKRELGVDVKRHIIKGSDSILVQA